MEKLFELIRIQIRSANITLKRFDDELTKDAAHAFRWSEDAMRAAASSKVWAEIDRMARRDGATVERIAAKIQREALDAASDDISSTSACSNLMCRFNAASLARAAQEIGYIVACEEINKAA